MIKAMLFDLGEVFFIIDNKKLDEELIKKTGVSIKPSTGKHFQFYVDFVEGKISIEKYFDNLRKAVNSNATIETLRKVYSDAYIKYSVIDKSMVELAKELKKNYKLFCITNTNLLHKNINEERGLFDVFEKVFSSTESKRLKNAHWFRDILTELNLSEEECIFIDDLSENISQAREAGINSIQFTDRESLVRSLAEYNILIK